MKRDGMDSGSAKEAQKIISRKKSAKAVKSKQARSMYTEDDRKKEADLCTPELPRSATGQLNLSYFKVKGEKYKFGAVPEKKTLADELEARGKEVPRDKEGVPKASGKVLLLQLALCIPDMTEAAWNVALAAKTDVIIDKLATTLGKTPKWN